MSTRPSKIATHTGDVVVNSTGKMTATGVGNEVRGSLAMQGASASLNTLSSTDTLNVTQTTTVANGAAITAGTIGIGSPTMTGDLTTKNLTIDARIADTKVTATNGTTVGTGGTLAMNSGTGTATHTGDVTVGNGGILTTSGTKNVIQGNLTLRGGNSVFGAVSKLNVTQTTTVANGAAFTADTIGIGASTAESFTTKNLTVDATSANASVTADTTTVGMGGVFEMKSAGAEKITSHTGDVVVNNTGKMTATGAGNEVRGSLTMQGASAVLTALDSSNTLNVTQTTTVANGATITADTIGVGTTGDFATNNLVIDARSTNTGVTAANGTTVTGGTLTIYSGAGMATHTGDVTVGNGGTVDVFGGTVAKPNVIAGNFTARAFPLSFCVDIV